MNFIQSAHLLKLLYNSKLSRINGLLLKNTHKFLPNLNSHDLNFVQNNLCNVRCYNVRSKHLLHTTNNFQKYAEAVFSYNLISNYCKRRAFTTYDSPVDRSSRLRNSKVKPQENNNDIPKNQAELDDLGEEDLEIASKLYPAPKNMLHNIFNIVSFELKKPELKISPQYKHVRRGKNTVLWTCTYHLKWPSEEKFSHIAISKQEASTKAALASLLWLKKNKKINKFGQPLIYNAEETKKIKTGKDLLLSIDKNIEDKLKEIESIYQTQLLPHFVKETADKKVVSEDVDEYENNWPVLNQNAMKLNRSLYYSCEPMKLPISDFKENIKQIVKENQVVIVKGEPGCGKSTRVPQYVLEIWAENDGENLDPCRIIVTEPRRIAAISLAERVAKERDEVVGEVVGYQVRLKSKFNNTTGKILYCTTGILLRRLQSDPKLSDCSHIILDEAHERDVNIDLLMNLIRHALNLNPNLKLLIMSATIDTNVFQEYFNDSAVIHIPGFVYPVKVNFLDDIKAVDLSKTSKMCSEPGPYVVAEDVVKVINYIHKTQEEGAILCFLPGWEDIIKVRNSIKSSNDKVVLCLHSRLEDKEQRKIFAAPPPGIRKIILATNIAETSVTIDDVVYVIDTGIHKEQRFDGEKGIRCIDNHWISQASMCQRKGRAGRVQKGESYHLYPRSKYESFEKFSIPEIMRTSLTKIVLDSKVYSNNMKAMEFLEQLPCPPDGSIIMKAVEELKELELLDENENLTPLGRTVSDFQLEPKLSKAMVNSVIFKCVTPIVDIVTLFSSETNIFASGLIDKEGVKNTKQAYSRSSDHLSMMKIFEEWLESIDEKKYDVAEEFCSENSLLGYRLGTIKKLRDIHFEYLYKGLHNVLPVSDDFSDNDELVKAVLLSGVGNILQHRFWDIVKGRLKNTNVLLTKNKHKATISSESVNYKRHNYPSDFLVYINETRSNVRRTTIVRESSMVSPLSMLLFKNNKLEIMEVPDKMYSDEIKLNTPVLLRLKGTKIEFICDKDQAIVLAKCKEALHTSLQYYIFHLTEGGDYNGEVNSSWKRMLTILGDVLEESKVNC